MSVRALSVNVRFVLDLSWVGPGKLVIGAARVMNMAGIFGQ